MNANYTTQYSLWYFKKVDQQTSKDVNLLQHRINFLAEEDKCLGSKITQAEKKYKKHLDIRQKQDLWEQRIQQGKQQLQFQSEQRKEKHQIDRLRRLEQRNELMKAYQEYKKQETDQVKNLSTHHEEIIKKHRETTNQSKKQKYAKVKEDQESARQHFTTFWDKRRMDLHSQIEKDKEYHLQMALNNQKSLESLSNIETSMIQKLQISQQKHQSIINQLNQAKGGYYALFKTNENQQQTPKVVRSPKTFIEIYRKPKRNSHRLKISKNSEDFSSKQKTLLQTNENQLIQSVIVNKNELEKNEESTKENQDQVQPQNNQQQLDQNNQSQLDEVEISQNEIEEPQFEEDKENNEKILEQEEQEELNEQIKNNEIIDEFENLEKFDPIKQNDFQIQTEEDKGENTSA